MASTKVLVVEDEQVVLKDLVGNLEKLGYRVVGSASNGDEAFSLASDKNPHIVLMDIKIQGKEDGTEVATKIREELHIPVVYLTAFADEDTLDKAKVTQPYGYIVKPYKEEDLRTTIETAIYKHTRELKSQHLYYSLADSEGEAYESSIFIKSKNKLVKIRKSDIYFIEALKDYVVVNTLEEKYTIHSTMKDVVGRLESNKFVRVHRSFIVRTDRIASIEYPNLRLENNKKIIPIGGSYKSDLIKSISLI